MKELLLIIVSSALVNNVVLSQFMGLCPFLGVSKTTDTAAGMGGAVIFVITLSSFVTSVIYKLILQPCLLYTSRCGDGQCWTHTKHQHKSRIFFDNTIYQSFRWCILFHFWLPPFS